jgi:hypothetical protein
VDLVYSNRNRRRADPANPFAAEEEALTGYDGQAAERADL